MRTRVHDLYACIHTHVYIRLRAHLRLPSPRPPNRSRALVVCPSCAPADASCAFVCACVRLCARVCACVRACARVCVRVLLQLLGYTNKLTAIPDWIGTLELTELNLFNNKVLHLPVGETVCALPPPPPRHNTKSADGVYTREDGVYKGGRGI